jgi:hypothetical protein
MRLLFIAFLSISAVLGYENVCAATGSTDNPLAKTFSTELLNQLGHCLQGVERRYRDDPQFEFDIHRHCQSLAQHLAQEDFSPYLQQPLDDNLTVDQLMDLQSIGTTIHTSNAAVRTFKFDFQGLPELLGNTLVLEKEPDLSWWKRFLNWLAEFFEKTESQQPDWLKDWLTKLSIPAWAVKAFYTGTVILLAILLLALVIVEVRAAGISNWFKRRAQHLRAGDIQTRESHDAMLTWDAIFQLPDKDKILNSYNKLLYLLAVKNLIPRDSSLTNHELQACLEKSLGAEQSAFRQLVRGVETTLYGDKAMDHDTVSTISRNAAQFADSLEAQRAG